MTRLSELRREDLDADGQRLWDGIVGSRPEDLVNASGGLIGPFNAFLHAPVTGRRLSALGAAIRFETSIDRRLTELAVITVSARWQSEFEWWAHARMAAEHGIGADVITAIAERKDPPITAGDERTVYTVARQLTDSGRLDAPAYEAGLRLLGERGMVELVSLCGYYTLISYLLNAFEVPLPGGAKPKWG